MKFEIQLDVTSLKFLLFVNILGFVLAGGLFFLLGGFDTSLFNAFGGLNIQRVLNGDFWLIITSNFLHFELLHFALNIYSLYQIGKVTKFLYNGKKLFITYIFGGIASSLLTILMFQVFTSSQSYLTDLVFKLAPVSNFSLGASGSIFALAGLLLGGSLKKRRYGRELPISTSSLVPFVVGSILFGFISGFNVNNWAHLGGLGAGVLLGLFLKHEVGDYKTEKDKLLENILFYISVGIFSVSYFFLILNLIS